MTKGNDGDVISPSSILFSNSAQEVCEDLKLNGTRIFHLKRALSTIKQNQDSVTMYFAKIKSLWDEYITYKPGCSCSTCNCGGSKKIEEFIESEFLISFLMGLNPAYDHARSQILLMDPSPSVNKAFSLIAQEEEQRILNNLNTRPRNQNRPICTHCNMLGHTVDKCYKIHGYPIGYRQRRNQQGGSQNSNNNSEGGTTSVDVSDVTHSSSGEEENDSPIEEVRLTVPPTDDPSEPALTFRTWVLGLTSCCLLAFVNQFFGFHQNQLYVSSVSAQILVLPLGKLMATTIPSTSVQIPLTKWAFSLNPGPFTLKEHVLITIFANSGSNRVYASNIVTIVKAFYHRNLHPLAAMLLSQTTQMLGYGWAGLFRRYLVDSPYMWWPETLVQVSLFRALHEKDERPKGGHTRLQFFFMVFISSFAYYLVPSYLFPSISRISFVCLIWRNSITAQQIGSGLHGLGIGSFGIDWSTVAGFLRSPLPTPGFAIINILIGFVMVVYIINPIVYWSNLYEAKRFPMISTHTFDFTGKTYNISRILNAKTFDIDQANYDGYSKLYLSAFFAFIYGLSFAALTATISHVALFHGKTIWRMWRRTESVVGDQLGDVHTRLMRKNYKIVPQWWFFVIRIIMVALAFYACEGFDKQLQLPWWGILLACAIAMFFTLPIGIIQATTNQQPGLNVITEFIFGYMYPGRPLANVTFKTYGYVSMSQALMFLSDFKLGHYMKIPPRSMFLVQLVGTVVASSVYFGTAWWLLTTVNHICDPASLLEGSPWTCPNDNIFYNASIIWGVVGPLRMFGKLGVYPQMNWFFLIGLLAPVPVWWFSRRFPNQKWIRLINIPIIFGGGLGILQARSMNYLTWGAVGIFFNFYIYRKHKGWWARHNYILSAALDAGVAFMGVLIYFTLQSKDIIGPNWWGLDTTDHCPLASCPTAPGIVVEGCPVH